MRTYIHIIVLLLIFFLAGCKPELPATSSITITTEGVSYPVNEQLYGLTIEEINHAIDGGIYAEYIQNRSFEEGSIPLHCAYDRTRNVLVTPNGWTIPFIHPDSIPGWRKLADNSYISTDDRKALSEKNQRSLMVAVYASEATGRGGVIAEGYKGIPIRKGEKYNLSFYTRTATSVTPRSIRIALEDSSATKALSNTVRVTPTFEWRKQAFTFTANEDAENAVLTFSTDSSTFFWLDVVSLMPEKTWKNRPNGLRPDIMEKIADLSPAFIRFPGGSFVEGYTSGTYPKWRESIGDIAERKHFWNIWGYGSSNGVGYHEFLQMCEDLKAEPVYVVNSGITSQCRRPRIEDITQMNILVQETLDAIAYANQPADSTFGAMRASNGHQAPFHLKYIEIGSENYGIEYSRRFELFKNAIHAAYPDMTVISSSLLRNQNRNDWVDDHYYATESFFISNHERFSRNYERQSPSAFIGEFSSVGKEGGTLRAAVAEACFLIAAESNPDGVMRLAYAPALGNRNYDMQRYPLITFNQSQITLSPSYYLLQMFNKYRGDTLLNTEVETFSKPQVLSGRAAIEVPGNNYEIDAANPLFAGDSLSYNYELSLSVKHTKGDLPLRLFVRDNGQRGDEADYICLAFGNESSELYRQTGTIKDMLTPPKAFKTENEQWYKLKVVCKDDTIRCYADRELLHEAILAPFPSLVALATSDKEQKKIILKVVNTTHHKEKTEIHIPEVKVKRDAEIVELSNATPVEKTIHFPGNRKRTYTFPANSVTIIKLSID
ncbi:alpha-N-arabinofuranosidase [Parabacteroides sp. PF5-5]|uniref:alpha-L-arabinofuranosidase C-terminal domain-containing protein n=1 Tax=unclassified Parabacteroides TaxID=2649774 RepID=UPI0024750F14|nr:MULTISPECIES: alpha-L-arabinofuranosidase C-terminal domain-containing protein [unclassified Parabacteroides]MDH6306546.1 alpha-N-arabinofuranosidase [Parabacteroides sp. PH5-39]MDH6317513.1 alpha-N-arabinofuranosidase [Parabacteroides sp. PF5-13]MDH6321257.1 alpha-N-arabinofuranosidase [Parabacteroides sp. PH5-13]MDH6324989.1 alpha-N-arabinofuranosidase [Parabacteroides sp. PH5-8]MDH6328698.1 alpha-N-arabinofuranosidase [Parabacteroides sp. PH5-41]